LSDPLGMVLTMLWLVAAAGWAVWRFWLRPASQEKASRNDAKQPPSSAAITPATFLTGVTTDPTHDGGDRSAHASEADPRNWYGGLVQTVLLVTVALVFLSAEVAARYKFPARLIAWEWFGLFVAFFVVRQLAVTPTEQRGLFAVVLAGAAALAAQ